MFAAVMERPGGPEVLIVREVPEPEARRGGLVIKVRAIGLQGGDLLNRRVRAVDGPHVVGYQASGIVHDVGEGVDDFTVGDRVVATMMHGSHAEFASVSAKKTWHVPQAVTFEHAAAVPIEFGTAHDALFEFARLASGETVLVQGGAGGVGLAAVQLAHAAGARVIATAGDDERLDKLTEYGMDHGVNYRTADVAEAVMTATDGRGADVVLDPVGGETLETSIRALGYRGRISWIGNSAPRPAETWPLMERNGTLMPQFFALEQSRQPERTYALVAQLLERVANGELQVAIDRQFPLSSAAEAHEYAESAHPFGRLLLVPDQT